MTGSAPSVVAEVGDAVRALVRTASAAGLTQDEAVALMKNEWS